MYLTITDMETTITKTTVRTNERVSTANAIYDVDSTRTDGQVTNIIAKVTAQITATDEAGNPVTQGMQVGTIGYNNYGILRTDGLTVTDNLPAYITEFLEIVKMVKERE